MEFPIRVKTGIEEPPRVDSLHHKREQLISGGPLPTFDPLDGGVRRQSLNQGAEPTYTRALYFNPKIEAVEALEVRLEQIPLLSQEPPKAG